MQITSWNVNSLKVRLPQVQTFLEKFQPDLLCLQETKLPDDRFPTDHLREQGYAALYHGQSAYNGVAMLSRAPLADPECGFADGEAEPQARLCAATCASVRVVNVYVPNGQALDSDKYAFKLRWLAALREYLRDALARWPRLVVLGDFNIAPGDGDVFDAAAWGEDILCSPAERAALTALEDLGFVDAYRALNPDGREFTWWDYRAASFRRDRGLRIDLILVSTALWPQVRQVLVHREERGAERPSDHAPVSLFLESTP
ncbi:MAG: exodeoxyribonuclease III [Acidithiobacillus caldus]|nr:exodeoxyribonuclease III [Acidithiobacillus caldus]